ncbi:hypothetical protein [Bacteroides sp. 519]|uniref:hypothetical protein n=1 Tax=Bacteroides sp. 519 TaxID=2302937 RepID=UPI0013D0EBB3|nr:hypothetical protein [Bacteroides sp. 519]
MKVNLFAYSLLLLLVLISCTSKSLKQGEKETTINNAISDFLETEKDFLRDKVFGVFYYDTIGRIAYEKVDSMHYRPYRTVTYEDKVAVTIYPTYYQYPQLPTDSFPEAGAPTRYYIKDNKLFYWYDEDYPLTKEMVDVLKSYNLIYYITETIPDSLTIVVPYNDNGVDYFFCRKNLSKFTKITTDKAVGYYDIPLLNCDD